MVKVKLQIKPFVNQSYEVLKEHGLIGSSKIYHRHLVNTVKLSFIDEV